MRKIMMLGFVLCASLGCAQSVKGIDTTGQQRAAGDCRYYSEPKGLQPITLESPSAAVLNPDKAWSSRRTESRRETRPESRPRR